jgi:hypothetical protein
MKNILYVYTSESKIEKSFKETLVNRTTETPYHLINFNQETMKYTSSLSLTLSLSLLLAFHLPATAQQINNGGLESWQTFTNFEVPDSFYTFDQNIFVGTATTSKTTDAHSGQYAALLQTQAGPTSTNFSGTMSYGSFSAGPVNYFYGWPFAQRPTKLKFWYKYINPGNDTALCGIFLSKWTGLHTSIGSGIFYFSANTPNYTLAEIPVNYTSGVLPDTLSIGFMSSVNANPTSGTMLYIDDISLDYSTALESNPAINAIRVYPNPCSNAMYITIPSPGNHHLTIRDVLGSAVYEKDNYSSQLAIDCSQFNAGVYTIHLEKGASKFTGKVLKID